MKVRVVPGGTLMRAMARQWAPAGSVVGGIGTDAPAGVWARAVSVGTQPPYRVRGPLTVTLSSSRPSGWAVTSEVQPALLEAVPSTAPAEGAGVGAEDPAVMAGVGVPVAGPGRPPESPRAGPQAAAQVVAAQRRRASTSLMLMRRSQAALGSLVLSCACPVRALVEQVPTLRAIRINPPVKTYVGYSIGCAAVWAVILADRLEAVDGTPIIDIKPVMDAVEEG